MQKVGLYIFVVLLMFGTVQAQEISWKLEQEFLQKNIHSWDVNPLQELIFSTGRKSVKLNKDFKEEFTQSNSSFGFLSEIDARHSLKILVFSENQQMLGFWDNTLSFQEGKIDLSNLGINYATQVCYSDNTNRFWVYDEQNSRLIQFHGLKSSVKQVEITNLIGITGENSPHRIIESYNQLLVFYQGSGVFVFDYYGSLIRKFENKNAKQIYPFGDYIYLLEENEMSRINRITGDELKIKLPFIGIKDFRIFENQVFFLDKKGVHKYSLSVK